MSVDLEQYMPIENEECQATECKSKENEAEVSKNSQEIKEVVENSTFFQDICVNDVDDTYTDPDWISDLESSAKRPKLMEIDIVKICSGGQKENGVPSTPRNKRAILMDDSVSKIAENEVNQENFNDNTENTMEAEKNTKCTKRMKGIIRKREEEKFKKDQGLGYKSKKGILLPARMFKPVEECCNKRKCDVKIKPEYQRKIYNDFYTLPVCARDKALAAGIRISTPSVRRKKKDTCETRVTNDRMVTVSYYVTLDGTEIEICKTMFIGVFGLSRGKVDVII